MNRAAALTLLQNEYQELVTEAKLSTTQRDTALNAAIDMALRQLGFAEADLPTAVVADNKTLVYIALLHYYALFRFMRILALKFDVAVGQGAVDAKRSQMYKYISDLFEEAKATVLAQGIDIDGSLATSGFSMGYLNLDYLQPSSSYDEYAQGGW